MFRRKTVIIAASTVAFVFFFTLNYLLTFLPSTESEVRTNSQIENSIYEELKRLPDIYKVSPQVEARKADEFLKHVNDVVSLELQNLKALWDEANSWPSKDQITNTSSPSIGKVVYALKHARITMADIDTRGTQLKLLLNLMVI